jgi:hypothetical protein
VLEASNSNASFVSEPLLGLWRKTPRNSTARPFWCIDRTAACSLGADSESSCSAQSHRDFREGRDFPSDISSANCSFRTRCASSMPERVTAAVRNDFSPNIGAHRCLMAVALRDGPNDARTRGQSLDPPHDCGMRNGDFPLGHHRRKIAVAESVREVPANASLYCFGRKATPPIDRVARSAAFIRASSQEARIPGGSPQCTRTQRDRQRW